VPPSVVPHIENVVTVNHSEGKVSRNVAIDILSYMYIMFCTTVLAGGEKNELKFVKLTSSKYDLQPPLRL
jgi:hypothetical protein